MQSRKPSQPQPLKHPQHSHQTLSTTIFTNINYIRPQTLASEIKHQHLVGLECYDGLYILEQMKMIQFVLGSGERSVSRNNQLKQQSQTVVNLYPQSSLDIFERSPYGQTSNSFHTPSTNYSYFIFGLVMMINEGNSSSYSQQQQESDSRRFNRPNSMQLSRSQSSEGGQSLHQRAQSIQMQNQHLLSNPFRKANVQQPIEDDPSMLMASPIHTHQSPLPPQYQMNIQQLQQFQDFQHLIGPQYSEIISKCLKSNPQIQEFSYSPDPQVNISQVGGVNKSGYENILIEGNLENDSPTSSINEFSRQPTPEFNTLKQISETVQAKLETFEKQLLQIQPTKKLPLLYHSETQTDDEITRLNVQDYEELKLQVFRLQDKVQYEKQYGKQQLEHAQLQINEYKSQVKQLQEDVQRLKDCLKVRKDFEKDQKVQSEQMVQTKEQLIKQLTQRLQDSTKQIQDLKAQKKKLQEQFESAVASQDETKRLQEQIVMMQQQDKDKIEKIKAAFKSKLDQLTSEGSLLLAENSNLREYTTELEQKIETSERDAERRLAQHQDELRQQLDRTKSGYQHQISLMQQELQQQQQLVQRKDSDLTKARERLSDLEREMLKLKELNKLLKLENEEKDLEIEKLKSKSKHESRKNSANTSFVQESKHDSERFHQMEKLYKEEIQVLNDQLTNLKAEHEDMKQLGYQKLQTLQTENSTLASENEQLLTKIADYEQ